MKRSPSFARRFTALLLLVGAFVSANAQAHEFWLSPNRYRAAAGDTIEVTAHIGTGFRGELKPYAASRVVHFSLRHARSIDIAHLARNGDAVMARFLLPDQGGALLAYEGDFADLELPGPQFDAYLALEGLQEPLAARRKTGASTPGRERYARCGKTWISGADPARLLAPAGLTFELTPLADPTRASEVRVRATYRGRALAGALVRAWRRPLATGAQPFDPAARDSVPPVAQARTGRDGVAALVLSGGGEWLLSAVHMVPSADPREADWESLWASLTFAREPLP
jgi:uncharacterized GH25 family protein